MDTFWAEFQFTEYSKILIANLALVGSSPAECRIGR